MSRRRLLGGGVAALGVAGVGAATGCGINDRRAEAAATGSDTVPWRGLHQAGIDTVPPQAHSAFVGLNLRSRVGRAELIGILKVWTEDIGRLTAGAPALADTEAELALRPARLTITVGLGPGVFDAIGLPDRRPSWLAPLPAFEIDRLEPEFTGGDLILQVCSDDPVTVAHAVRVLTKNVRSLVTIAWTQRGFRRARGTEQSGTTMRNLMGQVDGTVNPAAGSTDFDTLVWDDGSDQPWMQHGTSMVLRRIRIEMDTWDELDRPGRELSVGRTLDTGAPLTGASEFDEADFDATDRFGIPVIPPSSHIARARHTREDERIFRRAYNYDDPPDPGSVSNSGLLFASYQRDVLTQFLPIQQRLDEFDALNEWTTPIGSAVFAILPGVVEDGYLGQSLLE
ncbi:Dyp-type peroxidase [Rhodococcus sp. KRD162]|uniref:Dyp-type peroxidase n=1 Tax=Rhodococcus sp. KRD162 TaxID=2729725 RepID=UPI0019CFD836|nr:Dyp-type peroxidase [Rhodococcus sp. KRD162]